jgi:hypothetical protein
MAAQSIGRGRPGSWAAVPAASAPGSAAGGRGQAPAPTRAPQRRCADRRAAGLTPAERHVVRERLAGRSYRQIAADAALGKPGGGAYTRQRVQQIERDATAKLGLAASLAVAVHAAERVDRALDLAERGERVRAADLHLGPEAVRPRLRRVARWEREHEAAVQAFLAEAEHARRRGVSPARVAEVGRGR